MIPLIAAGWIALGLLRSSKTQQAAAAAKSGAPGSGGSGSGSPEGPGVVLSGSDFLPGPGVVGVNTGNGTRTEVSPAPPAYIETRAAPGGGFVSVLPSWPPWHIPVVDLCGKAFIPERCMPIWGAGQTWYDRYDQEDCGTCQAIGKGKRARQRRP